MTSSQPTFGHGGNARFDEEVTDMVSKAIAAVDAWLESAERLLKEQRAQGISPSSTPAWDPRVEESTLSVATFVDGLKDLLDSLCARPGRWILIAEDAKRPHLFWQALAFEDGSLESEVVSNYYLAEDRCWSRDEEEQLVKLGWEPPEPPKRTNWINVEYTTSPPTGLVACRTFATLRFAFGLGLEDTLTVRLFSSPVRGDTPASSLRSGESDAELIHPMDGSDEEDPVLHSDPSADGPPWADYADSDEDDGDDDSSF